MPFPNQLEVNLPALKHNVRLLKKIVGPKLSFYPVVKSNAYGLGVSAVTTALLEEGLRELAVLNTKEAQSITSKNVKLLLMEPFTEEDLPLILENPHWQMVIGSFENLIRLSFNNIRKYIKKKTLSIHIKIEMGLSRFGFHPSDIPKILTLLQEQKHLKLEGVCGHLPGGHSIQETKKQIIQFENIKKTFQENFSNLKFHLFNSINFIACYTHNIPLPFGVRIGGCLYGIKHPVHFQDKISPKKWQELDLKPVSTLKSRIVSLKKINKRQRVSYEGQWTAPRSSVIAVVPMGYADGFLKNPSKPAYVLLRGQKAPIVGQVCMNCFMIDITEIESPQVGEEIVIYGKQKGNQIDIKDFLLYETGTPYEVMTRLHNQVQRVYK